MRIPCLRERLRQDEGLLGDDVARGGYALPRVHGHDHACCVRQEPVGESYDDIVHAAQEVSCAGVVQRGWFGARACGITFSTRHVLRILFSLSMKNLLSESLETSWSPCCEAPPPRPLLRKRRANVELR